MFTGLIEEIGSLRRLKRSASGAELVIAAKKVLADIKIGDSVAVSGPCLTVTAFDRDSFTVFVMPETLKRSTLGSLQAGSRVNLERALALGARLGGHMVSGHIDDQATLRQRSNEGEAIILYFTAPRELLRYLVPKGSVALDGVSLTVISVDENGFSVGLIPHTAGETTIGSLEIGAAVNLEVDLIGKYVEKMLQPRLEQGNKKGEALTLNYLREQGYL